MGATAFWIGRLFINFELSHGSFYARTVMTGIRSLPQGSSSASTHEAAFSITSPTHNSSTPLMMQNMLERIHPATPGELSLSARDIISQNGSPCFEVGDSAVLSIEADLIHYDGYRLTITGNNIKIQARGELKMAPDRVLIIAQNNLVVEAR